ncbi:serine/threonine-protein kinase [Idiomarina fontislapidosi]|uniref:serine/threonine-protein kinase n=1 Tax=Idiomarina fontislapidosi TaxID=263723 RepID=UPI000D831618|nr:serine/threonine-protein kinase [Idiomarina fontislapidosi]PYE33786.1 serine/threonine-protein kinase [Idiomarina fontislapidosi]
MDEASTNNKNGLQFPYPISERFRCRDFLGSGGSGVVFKAWDELLQRMVAIKFIKNPTFISRQRLVAEARALAKLNHPSLCGVYDVGEPSEDHSSLYMVMELIEGPRVTELAGQLSISDAVKLVLQLAEGVSHMHNEGLIHNDINPTNVIVKYNSSDESIPTLIDLSIAGRASSNRHKGFGVSPLFSAPEQRGNEIEQGRSKAVDIYGLGALLFFLVTGQAPSDEPKRQLKQYVDRCPRRLRRIILNCLHRDPNDRTSSAQLLVQQLTDYRFRRFPWLLPAAITLLISALVTTIAIGIIHYHFADNASSQAEVEIEVVSKIEEALAHSHFARELIKNNQLERAKQQAITAINYFKSSFQEQQHSTSIAAEMTELLVAIKPLLSRTEMMGLLLETTTYLESEAPEERTAKYHLALAKLYHQLTLLHQEKSAQTELWEKEALRAATNALAMRPDSSEVRAFVNQLYDQSNSGTD